MTKTEAEKEVEKLHKVSPDWFCPMIPGICRKDCVCFVEAFYWSRNPEPNGKLVDIKRNDFRTQSAYCGNDMFVSNMICPHTGD